MTVSVVDELGAVGGGTKSPAATDKPDGVLEERLSRESEVNKQLEEEKR